MIPYGSGMSAGRDGKRFSSDDMSARPTGAAAPIKLERAAVTETAWAIFAEPAPRENGAEESRDNQQADRATDHPKELRRDKEQSVSPKAILGARVMTGGEARHKPKGLS